MPRSLPRCKSSRRSTFVFSDNTGFTAGGYVGFSLSDNFTLQPELLYSERAIGLRFGGLIQDGRVVYEELFPDMGYLDVLSLAKLHTRVLGLPMHFEAGPSASFRVHCAGSARARAFDIGTGQLDNQKVAGDCDGVKKTDVAVVTGFGFDISIVGIPITLDLHEHFGLLEIATRLDTFSGFSRIKSRLTSVTVSAAFH